MQQGWVGGPWGCASSESALMGRFHTCWGEVSGLVLSPGFLCPLSTWSSCQAFPSSFPSEPASSCHSLPGKALNSWEPGSP